MTDASPSTRFACTVRPVEPTGGAGDASLPLPPNTLPIARAPRTEVTFDVRPGRAVLLEMVARGVRAIDVGCRGGGCGVCRVEVLEGHYETQKMSRRHVTEAEEAEGFALACRLVATSDLVITPAQRTA